MKSVSYLFFLSVLFATSPAFSGVADSPLPELVPGNATYHVYSVAGVIDSLGLGTFFYCTSLEPAATVQVGIELFDRIGAGAANDPAALSLSIPPGDTRVFGTSGAVWVSIDSNLQVGAFHGSARILATSKKIMCTAFLADLANAPPTSMNQLTIIAKTKQKACN